MTGALPDLYPQYCFHLSPTFDQWCLLHATAVHALDRHREFEGQGLFFHRNLPIKWIRLVGIVVAIDDYASRRIFTIDDSSGACIECNVTVKVEPAPLPTYGDAGTLAFAPRRLEFQLPGCEDIDVGSVVDIKGSVAVFREEKTVNIQKVKVLRSTAQEVALWERRAEFKRDVLGQPWVVGEKQLRRCRREAEGRDRKQRRVDEEKKRREEAEKPATGLESSRRRKLGGPAGSATEGTPDIEEIADGLGRSKRPQDGQLVSRPSQGLERSRLKSQRKPTPTFLVDDTHKDDYEDMKDSKRPADTHLGYPLNKAAQGLERSQRSVWRRESVLSGDGCREENTADGLGRSKASKPSQSVGMSAQGLERSRTPARRSRATIAEAPREEEHDNDRYERSKRPKSASSSRSAYSSRKPAEGLESSRQTSRYRPEEAGCNPPENRRIELDGFGRPKKARGSLSTT